MSKIKSPALGKGLEALLGTVETKVSKNTPKTEVDVEIANIPIEKIIANENQPRKNFDAKTLEELAQSIKENGVIVPITVNKKEDKYVIIAGERRFRASKIAGLNEIPAYIRIVSQNSAMQMALIENIQRQDLNALEISLSLKALLEQTKMPIDELAKKLGKSRSNISNYIRLLNLPAEIQLAISNNKLSMGHARALINISDEKEQIELCRKTINEGLSVREVETYSNKLKNKTIKAKNKQKEISLPEIHNKFVYTFSKQLNTIVAVKRSKRGKGNITIAFKNDEEFQRIINLLSNQ